MRLAEPRFAASGSTEPRRASPEEIETIARSRMESARVDILLDHPYFAAALLAIPMRGTSDSRIAHPLVTDGTRIVYRHDLIAALERPRVRMLMMHALAHSLLRHPERGGSRKWDAWTSACDIAVDLLFEHLGLLRRHEVEHLHTFKNLSAEAIYKRLTATFSCRQSAKPMPAPSSPPSHLQADGLQPPSEGDQSSSGESCSAGHTDARSAFERAMAGAEGPTKLHLQGLQRDFMRALEDQPGGCVAGTQSGSSSSEIDAAQREQVRWQQVLARFMCETIDQEWSFSRPNRKHLWRGIYLPGPIEITGGRFVVAIDTSGSMSDRDLGLVLGEIDAIRRTCACELTVLQFDGQIHATAEFSRWSDEDETVGSTKVMRVFGRGGTDLRLPFTWAEEERRKGRSISALIVCTDGFGPLPGDAPAGLPVLFLLTPQHAAPSFGEQLVLRFNG
jgi:predicted metal-dependent peptidase